MVDKHPRSSSSSFDPPRTSNSIEFPITPYPNFDRELSITTSGAEEVVDRPKIRPVRRIAAVIIGDEILNGKTLDTNSHQLASLSFSLGIQLGTVQVIPDDERSIVECLRRLCRVEEEYDMIITSGGIGPTHDDITYQSLAKVFDPKGEMEYDQETIRRMEVYNDHHPRSKRMITRTEEQRLARRRMALFPKHHTEILFVQPHLWVPVVRLHHKIYILPGVPTLFQQLLQALLWHYIPLPPESEKPHRVTIQTTHPESIIAPILTDFSTRFRGGGKVDDRVGGSQGGIKIGSYPNLITGQVTVSLIGSELDRLNVVADQIRLAFDRLASSPSPSPDEPTARSTPSDDGRNKL